MAVKYDSDLKGWVRMFQYGASFKINSHHVRSCVVIRQNHLLAKIFDIPQENIIVNNAVYLTTVEEAMIVERGKENTPRDSRAFCGDDTFHVFSFFLKESMKEVRGVQG